MRKTVEEKQNTPNTPPDLRTGITAVSITSGEIWICFSLVLLKGLEAASKLTACPWVLDIREIKLCMSFANKLENIYHQFLILVTTGSTLNFK